MFFSAKKSYCFLHFRQKKEFWLIVNKPRFSLKKPTCVEVPRNIYKFAG